MMFKVYIEENVRCVTSKNAEVCYRSRSEFVEP